MSSHRQYLSQHMSIFLNCLVVFLLLTESCLWGTAAAASEPEALVVRGPIVTYRGAGPSDWYTLPTAESSISVFGVDALADAEITLRNPRDGKTFLISFYMSKYERETQMNARGINHELCLVSRSHVSLIVGQYVWFSIFRKDNVIALYRAGNPDPILVYQDVDRSHVEDFKAFTAFQVVSRATARWDFLGKDYQGENEGTYPTDPALVVEVEAIRKALATRIVWAKRYELAKKSDANFRFTSKIEAVVDSVGPFTTILRYYGAEVPTVSRADLTAWLKNTTDRFLPPTTTQPTTTEPFVIKPLTTTEPSTGRPVAPTTTKPPPIEPPTPKPPPVEPPTPKPPPIKPPTPKPPTSKPPRPKPPRPKLPTPKPPPPKPPPPKPPPPKPPSPKPPPVEPPTPKPPPVAPTTTVPPTPKPSTSQPSPWVTPLSRKEIEERKWKEKEKKKKEEKKKRLEKSKKKKEKKEKKNCWVEMRWKYHNILRRHTRQQVTVCE